MNYLAGGHEWLYPDFVDPYPPPNTKVLLLTPGGTCVVGVWDSTYLAWLPLPKRNKTKEAYVQRLYNTQGIVNPEATEEERVSGADQSQGSTPASPT